VGTTPRGHAQAPLSDQRAGLRTEPRFARLLGAALLSGLGDQINRIAVLTVVYTSTRSGFIVSLSIAIRMAAVVVTGPVGAVVADRFPRKTLMVTSDLVRAGLAAALVWTANGRNLALLLVLIALIEANSAIFAPARSASIPNLVRERNLAWANGLDQSVTGLVMTLGSVCGGVAVAALGVRSAFLLNSASFVV
jgi:MFS family permease